MEITGVREVSGFKTSQRCVQLEIISHIFIVSLRLVLWTKIFHHVCNNAIYNNL